MVLYTDDGCKYEGMDSATVTALRSGLGKSTVFVDKVTFDSFVAAQGE